MIITDKFVYIHMPKTGGTFVETVLHKIHEARGDVFERRRADQAPRRRPLREWFQKRRPVFLELYNQAGGNDWNQHGHVSQIPPEHAHKPILTTLRNPDDRYVSQYEFEWWKQNPGSFFRHFETLKERYPNYPELTFEEFVTLSNAYSADEINLRFEPDDQLGRHTVQFIKYFYRNPALLTEIDAAYLAEKRYEADLAQNLHYTFTHDLNQQLYDFLRTMDYAHEEIAFVLQHKKVLPNGKGRNEDQKWEKYYTPALKAYVRHHERLLYTKFPVFDC